MMRERSVAISNLLLKNILKKRVKFVHKKIKSLTGSAAVIKFDASATFHSVKRCIRFELSMLLLPRPDKIHKLFE